MALLAAKRERQGEHDGDFCHAVEGELVFAGVGQRDRPAEPAGGCGRAFSGLNPLRATKTALGRDLELSWDDVRLALSAHCVVAVMGLDNVGATDFKDKLDEEVEQTIAYAQVWEPGAVVGRRLDPVYLRSPAVW